MLIVGGGFAGLATARTLERAPVDLTLIDRQNHHCFQPLLYQVATAALTPSDVAWPIRGILSRQKNARVLMTEVTGIDPQSRTVRTTGGDFPYDYLVLATGATHAYFGREDWETHAPGLKRIEDATEIRRRILTAFERAELSDDPLERRNLTTFAVVGGGPTGVEMAGAIADIARDALAPDFRNVSPREARILLIEGGPRLLPAFPEVLSAYTRRALEARGVEVITGEPVVRIDSDTVGTATQTWTVGAIVWAAGVQASPAAKWLGAEHDRVGRAVVGADLIVPGLPDVFVIGDTASVSDVDGKPIPGIAPAAKQMGRHAGQSIAARVGAGPDPGPFRYRHQGDLATIGKNAAVVKLKRLTLTGFVGWCFWSLAHVYFLIGARNRIAVGFSWVWDYLTFGRRARLITHPTGFRQE